MSDVAYKKIGLEQLDWTCGCGKPYALILPPQGGWLDLECKHCGLVGSVSVRPKPIKRHA